MTSDTVLIVDDDRTQLKLYSWILEHGGFRPVTALVHSSDVEWPPVPRVDVIALDYRLNSKLTAVEVARALRERFPATPILVLSEMLWMANDIAPMADGFVSKGDPEKLLEAIRQLIDRKRNIGHAC